MFFYLIYKYFHKKKNNLLREGMNFVLIILHIMTFFFFFFFKFFYIFLNLKNLKLFFLKIKK